MKSVLSAITILLLLCCFSCFSQKTDTIVKPVLYLYVDEAPKFKGGHQKLKEFIDHNIQWPGEFDGQGTVLTSFVVNKNGNVSNIKIEKGICDECNAEAIRLIKLLPEWIPGKVNFQNVDVLMYLPIKFKIEN